MNDDVKRGKLTPETQPSQPPLLHGKDTATAPRLLSKSQPVAKRIVGYAGLMLLILGLCLPWYLGFAAVVLGVLLIVICIVDLRRSKTDKPTEDIADTW